MKKYVDEKGHILFLSPSVGVDISDEEAKEIMAMVDNRPVCDQPSFMYRLSDATREWELVEVPEPVEEEEVGA